MERYKYSNINSASCGWAEWSYTLIILLSFSDYCGSARQTWIPLCFTTLDKSFRMKASTILELVFLCCLCVGPLFCAACHYSLSKTIAWLSSQFWFIISEGIVHIACVSSLCELGKFLALWKYSVLRGSYSKRTFDVRETECNVFKLWSPYCQASRWGPGRRINGKCTCHQAWHPYLEFHNWEERQFQEIHAYSLFSLTPSHTKNLKMNYF